MFLLNILSNYHCGNLGQNPDFEPIKQSTTIMPDHTLVTHLKKQGLCTRTLILHSLYGLRNLKIRKKTGIKE